MTNKPSKPWWERGEIDVYTAQDWVEAAIASKQCPYLTISTLDSEERIKDPTPMLATACADIDWDRLRILRAHQMNGGRR